LGEEKRKIRSLRHIFNNIFLEINKIYMVATNWDGMGRRLGMMGKPMGGGGHGIGLGWRGIASMQGHGNHEEHMNT
jgi:hypothetical protein